MPENKHKSQEKRIFNAMPGRNLELLRTAYTFDQLELPFLPQIALAGRSNVGKSSLLNCLAGSKKLAKTSSTPGKTRSINFYHVRPGDYCLVDLPGYGYARCSKQERRKWAQLIEQYFHNNSLIQAVVSLIDSRIPPQPSDLELQEYIRGKGIRLILVLTKVDKCNQRQLTAASRQWEQLSGSNAPPLAVSAKTGRGCVGLMDLMEDIIASSRGPIQDSDL